ncbi:MAG: PAS domain-containing protein [Planctomycetes bacterium]|nr:PAS domain-containing protein [Planctomycetota bacterium]
MDLMKKLKLLLPGIRVEKSRTLSIVQLVVAVLFLLGAALMCYVFIRNEWMSAANHVIATGDSLSDVIVASAEGPMERGNLAEVQAVVSRMNQNRNVVFVRIIDADGKPVAQSGRMQIAAQLVKNEPVDSWATPETSYALYALETTDEMFYVVEKQIGPDDKPVGRVQVAVEHPSLLSFVGKGLYRGEIAVFGVALLLMVGNYFLHALLGPITRLRRSVLEAQSAGKDMPWEGLALDLPKGGEAGDIASGIDNMMSKISKEYNKLLDSNRELQVSNRVILFDKRRTESIIDGLGEGVIVGDSYGRVSIINREAEVLLGVGRKDVIGKTPEEALPEHKEVAQFMTRDTSGPNIRRSAELDFSGGEGRKVVRIQLMPVSGRSERSGGALTMLRDVTQQKMEEQARGDFISNVAHELRAPLSAIKSYVEMLIDNEADTPALRAEFFNTINEEADRLARLIDNMLNISRIEVGGLVLNKSSVRTRKLLEDALTSVAATAKSKNIDIAANLPDDMPEADIDKEMVRVVVMNLLGNAIKYTEPGGSVILAGEVDAEELRVHVVDTGWGIPQDEHEKVFDKFYRGKRTGSSKVTGNGLGLALAKEIACLHGGDLRLESEEGKGSKFTLNLPLK